MQYQSRWGLQSHAASGSHSAVLARLPIDPAVAAACDRGEAENLPTDELEAAVAAIG